MSAPWRPYTTPSSKRPSTLGSIAEGRYRHGVVNTYALVLCSLQMESKVQVKSGTSFGAALCEGGLQRVAERVPMKMYEQSRAATPQVHIK